MPLFGGPPNVEKLKARQDVAGLIQALHYRVAGRHGFSFEDSPIQQAAAKALGELGGAQAVEALISVLQDPTRTLALQELAASALARIGGERVLEAFAGVLYHPNSPPSVMQIAAGALGNSGDPRAIKPLADALKTHARIPAAKALVHLGAPAFSALVAALQESDPEARMVAAVALGNLGDTRAIGALEPLFKDKEWQVVAAANQAIKALQAYPPGKIK